MARELTAAYMKEVNIGLSTVFNNALEKNSKDYEKIAMRFNATTPTVDYHFLGDLPNMREWVGDRVFKNLKGYKYTISKKNWESSIEIDRDVIIYDNLGVVRPKIEALAYTVEQHYNDMVFTLLEQNGVCLDGQNFFSKTHDIGGVNFSNLFDLPLNATNLQKLRVEMRLLKDENGKPLNLNPNLLVVPLTLEAVAREITQADIINGTTNPMKGIVEVFATPFLTNDKDWYLMDTTKPVKPFILQINKEVEFVAKDDPKDVANFMSRMLQYGIDTEDNVGYGLWQTAFKSSPAQGIGA